MRNKSHFESFIFKCPGVIRLVTLGLKEKFMEDTIMGKDVIVACDFASAEVTFDIVNTGLHFFLKDIRTMQLFVTNHNIAVV